MTADRCLRAAAVCLALWACESRTPTAPPPTPFFGWPAGTTLTIVSGERGQAVPGATIVIGGRSQTTDAAGQVRLDAQAADFTVLDVVAAGFLDRQTRVRSRDGTRISLWPKETASGLTEHTTAELVYTDGSYCCPAEALAQAPLFRIAPTIPSFSLVLDADHRGYAQTVAALREAAALAAAAVGGRVAFTVEDASTGPRIDVTTGPDPLGRPNVAAFADVDVNGSGYITGGRIVAVDADFLREGWDYVDTVELFAHELGHVLGLGHSTAPGIMAVVGDAALGYAYFRSRGDYSPTEKEVLALMYGRRALNRYPDNDRNVAAASVRSRRVICVR